MNFLQIARVIDLLALAFILGATAWFFFIQSPTLLKMMGREKFVPVQVRLTHVLFKSLTVFLLLMLVASVGHSSLPSVASCSAVIALAAGLLNRFVVLPRAFRAGGQSRVEIKGKDQEASAASFASEGTGQRTRVLHRLVVLLVLLMVAGVVTHGIRLLAA